MVILGSRLLHFASVTASWMAILLLTILSLISGDLRPHTGFSGHAEHFVAYFLTALPIGLAWTAGRTRAFATLGLSLAAGAFELLQNLSPGRGPAVSDWLASSSGAVVGMATLSLLFAFAGRVNLTARQASAEESTGARPTHHAETFRSRQRAA